MALKSCIRMSLLLVHAVTTVEETFSFSMVALVATYINNDNNKIYLLIISVDGEEIGFQLKVAWFS